MIKGIKRLVRFYSLGLGLFFCHTTTSTFSWIVASDHVEPVVSGSIHGSYFGGGNGTAESPYIINNPVHLYYLAWLQDLGYLNTADDNNHIDACYFVLADDIDMEGYVLPSIGTIENPFVGNFDGNGYTISNLVVTNNEEAMFELPRLNSSYGEDTQITGFFGVVGSYDEAGTINGYSYTNYYNEVKNFLLKNVTVKT